MKKYKIQILIFLIYFCVCERLKSMDISELANMLIPQDTRTLDNSDKYYLQKFDKALKEDLNTLPTISGIQEKLSEFEENLNAQSKIKYDDEISQIKLNNKKIKDNYNKNAKYLQRVLQVKKTKNLIGFSAPVFDQLFTNGIMLTPSNKSWYNPFRVGNWEYINNNEFKQYELIDWKPSSAAINIKNIKNSPMSNSIFTEFYTNKSNYTISFKLEIINYKKPFFAGILFNKSRWLSGNLNFSNRGRLLGIFVDENDKINLAFLENNPDIYDYENIVDPLNNVLSGKYTNLNKQALTELKLNKNKTTSFLFKVDIFSDQIKFGIWNLDKNKDLKQEQIILKNLNTDVFKFNCNGLAFISPGAKTIFKILEPTELLFGVKKKINNKSKKLESKKLVKK